MSFRQWLIRHLSVKLIVRTTILEIESGFVDAKIRVKTQTIAELVTFLLAHCPTQQAVEFLNHSSFDSQGSAYLM